MQANYDMPATSVEARKEAEIATEIYKMSDLQVMILRFICQNKLIDYDRLEVLLSRDRVTLLNSMHTLIDKGLVQAVKEQPDKQKSRQFFIPTDKGVCVGIGFVDGVTFKSIQANHPNNIFSQLVNDIRNENLREKLAISISKILLTNDNFSSTGQRKHDISFRSDKNGLKISWNIDEIWQFLDDINNIHDLENLFTKDYMRKLKKNYQETLDHMKAIIKELDEMGY